MKNKSLDEMQISIRNRIGSQTFILLLYLLLLDVGLHGFGISWLAYPANIMLLVTLCSSVYVIRLIKENAFVGPVPDKHKPVSKALLIGIFAVLTALVMLFVMNTFSTPESPKTADIAAPILLITAVVGISISLLVSIIKHRQNKE
jgi:predicted membrane-bound spermidine synthase